MKFVHLSDLHFGKRVNEYSMIDDQKYIVDKILGILDNEKPDAVLIAGDVYDRAIPSEEAVNLLDYFMVELTKRKLEVFLISGNHDSADRLAFGSRIMENSGVHISPVYNGAINPIKLQDQHGDVNVYLLPFVKPAHVRRFFEDAQIGTYTDAIKCVVGSLGLDTHERNVLVAHQFVTGARRSESEEVSVGGLDNVDSNVFEPFDYVALGHLHSPQNCDKESVRYCGTPLKYSFSEAEDKKSVTIVNLYEKGNVEYKFIELPHLHDFVEIRGKYEDITAKSFYKNKTWHEDYVHITLTDEEDVPNALYKLRAIYRRLMKLDYDNVRTQTNSVVTGANDVESKSPLELFQDFYTLQNGQNMSEEQQEYMKELFEKIWEAAE